MKLDHSTVLTARAVVQFLLRLCSVVLVLIGLVLIGDRILFGIMGNSEIKSAWTIWRNTGQWHGIFLGVPILVVGAGLGFFSAGLSRWMVRPSARGCSQCGYATLDDEGRCSECGYR